MCQCNSASPLAGAFSVFLLVIGRSETSQFETANNHFINAGLDGVTFNVPHNTYSVRNIYVAKVTKVQQCNSIYSLPCCVKSGGG